DDCPTEATSEGDIYVIDPDKCIDSGTVNEVFPVGAPNPA
ncbi:MAG: ferredoxin, partial [Firmicutes bacterium]|nr:ferredoxin [Bacillota bacterium]